MMKKLIYSISFLLLTIHVYGQHTEVLFPKVSGKTIKYTKAEQQKWATAIKHLQADYSVYECLGEAEKSMVDLLEIGEGPITIVGCGWHCGGGPYKMTASSHLPTHQDIKYDVENIHDANLLTAWVPNTEQGRIGQQIDFHFKPFSPKVNEIIIYNGYFKNEALWKANSRVAKLQLYINGKPSKILKLEDKPAKQSFTIAPVQSKDKHKNLVLTLEILEIYQGTKYDDVAISEINFNGIGVHCFGADSKILMANKTEKEIQNIQKGDQIITYNSKSQSLEEDIVKELQIARHREVIELKYEDRTIITTEDHPFWVENKG